ncbi:bifunctional phosphoribosylaminoimidazolecarboxamide formyltransferase/IMP cyclohydrolase [Anaplasma capra]|uniref:bifunctional phosphoribosylaminoimidazolecarboxamide formyltransferase/IMP cyclohydrolase n=1 Tax=Anaplasma capra TaxID=1562740 RepID=UPI0021D5E48F|nr:bifunctional phosphoribosylaminoimidazolecarboxamide formyltransferase/IMP cyclohydrolase [Anaplasma capra]MCU7611271.1 bifunctional phosphoribosylaminoimidazolecarboxamide formyltransferase/IMP cyclohydrolase [Anaplasma capra]MCU7612700.1 bifunctional phosphoribosylaminoimidazolecarboxamide formyltransferase/IMP cyclohydrolase [Anaplasma capra]
MNDSSTGRMALISVSDKTRIEELARFITEKGLRILATQNTYSTLKQAGIDAVEVSEYTGYPEMMDGRVKTLHPKIFAGILCNRDNHNSELEKFAIANIDLLVVNLYPFQRLASTKILPDNKMIEQIDIGGVSLLRAGAKNFQHVTVVSDVHDYEGLMQEMSNHEGATTLEYRRAMAARAFARVASYDACIHSWLVGNTGEPKMPQEIIIHGKKVQDLRIGENPHQKAAVYSVYEGGLPMALPIEQMHGKELSFNNVVDVESAVRIVAEFDIPAVSVIKHGNPCGAAVSSVEIDDAYEKAITCDPKSSFGGVIAFNREVTADIAKKVSEVFIEAVVAPSFAEEALEILCKKKSLRVIKCRPYPTSGLVLKSTLGSGFLLQERDNSMVGISDFLKVTTKEAPPEALHDLLFAWKVCKHVKSNAIVIARDGRAIGVGAGQMSRVDSVEIAVKKAQDCTDTVMASDAFFPFADSVQHAVAAGISAIVQPGGSVRDKEVIDAANSSGIAMYFTGFRSFCH